MNQYDARPNISRTQVRFSVSERIGDVSAILLQPASPEWLLVLAHGAGAGMRHAAMESISMHLADVRIATFRYQFPYMEAGRGGPNPPAVLKATVRAAAAKASDTAPHLPLLAGGKSMGGRMTSAAAADGPLPGVRGLVFFGFPLHPSGEAATTRADHLAAVDIPMLFLQGTRDKLADLDLLRPILARLPLATLQTIDGADHSFHLPKSAGRTDAEIMAEVATRVARWAVGVAPSLGSLRTPLKG